MADETRSDSFFGALWNAAADAVQGDKRVTPPSKREKALPKDPAKRFESSHWGVKPNKVWHDPDIQGAHTEMGKLRELHIEWEDADTGKLETEILDFPKVNPAKTRPPILAFTTDHAERLFLSQPQWVKTRNQELIDPDGEWVTLNDAAQLAGGRQAQWGYPNRKVQILGACTDIVYATHKTDDGPSEYIHKFSEETKRWDTTPLVCVDKTGLIWLAGGDYSVPDEGITN